MREKENPHRERKKKRENKREIGRERGEKEEGGKDDKMTYSDIHEPSSIQSFSFFLVFFFFLSGKKNKKSVCECVREKNGRTKQLF